MKRACLVAVALMLVLAGSVSAQIAGGNIYGTAVDQQGGVLPGATVTLTATSIGGQPRTTVTDASGQFRFLNLDAGNYRIDIDMPGFSKQQRELIVTTGINTTANFTLTVGAIEAAVNVTAESPVIDFKKTGTATTLTREELQGTPQSKDPWAMLKTVPGVIVDRVNVGGNESGQQSGFVGKGALATDSMWNLDGVVITDTTSGGASSSYFDFDAFDEVAVSTGGNDLKVQTGGVGINFVTRRGTNQFKGRSNTAGTVMRCSRRIFRASSWAIRDCRDPTKRTTRIESTMWVRYRRADHQGQAVVLGIVRPERHWHRPSHADRRPDDPEEHQREDQLVRDIEGRDLRILLQRREGEAGAVARAGVERGGLLPLEPGQFLSRGRVPPSASRALED